MASIEKRGGRWRCRWYEPSGKHRSKTFDRKADAERWLTKVSHDIYSGGYVDPDAGRMSFKAYAEEWRKARVHAASTADQVETNLRLHVYPTIGDVPMVRVRPVDVQTMINACTDKGLHASRVRTIYVNVSSVFRTAVRDRILAKSPCVDVELPPVPKRILELLTPDQVLAAADSIQAEYRLAVILGAGAGLRPGEARGLTVDRIDFVGGRITVDRQLLAVRAGRPIFGPPKHGSERVVPVPKSITDEISAHLAHWPTEGLVVTTKRRTPIARPRYNIAWTEARDTGGLPLWSTPHDLRHFYASMLIAGGLDVVTVQRRLGHASATITLDVYGHLWGDHEDRTRKAVDEALGVLFDGSRSREVPKAG